MHPSHIAANGVEQQSVIPPGPPTAAPTGSIARMPLVPAVLVVWTTSVLLRFYFHLLSVAKKRAGCDLSRRRNVQSSMEVQHLGKLFTQ